MKNSNNKEQESQKVIISSIVIPAIALVSSYAVKKLFDFSYKKIKRKKPPKSTHLDNHTMGYVVCWTIATSAIAGLVNLIATDVLKQKLNK